MQVSTADRQRVSDAIRNAESGTSGEFVCVLAQKASQYEFYPLAWSTLIALVLPWPLLLFTQWPLQRILLAQLVVFAAVLIVLNLPALRMYLVPRRVQRAAAHRAAAEQFLVRGLAHTPDRRGVLIFVSQAERYARILADDGAAAHVPPDQWQKAIDLLTVEARSDRHGDGFIAALAHCGQVMALSFPPVVGKTNELSDKFFVI